MSNYWHLTTNPNFKIDASSRYEVAQDVYVPMLFLSQCPSRWRSWATRVPEAVMGVYAIRVQPSQKVTPGDTGLPEHMDWDPTNARVLEILPIHEAIQLYPQDFQGWDY